MIWRYILKRILWMVPFLFAVSVVAFLLIQAPPGDYLTTYIAKLGESNEVLDQASIDNLRARFGLDQPLYVQYFKWVSNLVQGDFGMSFEWRQPVSDLVWERMGLTMMLSFSTLLFTWAVALPIGIYSAVRKYSIGDYIVTTLGFIGYFAICVGGLVSSHAGSPPDVVV